VTARLGLVALGIVAALAVAEGVLRLAAALDPHVRFLATGRMTRPVATYPTLEAFLAAQSEFIRPRQPWYNYWSNAFGFHDEEFVEPKPPGRFRILVVGDSFTFGFVPFPQGVMTLTEVGLRAACGGRDLDLLNMGVMGAGFPEYRILVELGAPRFSPDLVLVNVFIGNDPPDLHRHVHDRSPFERALRRSYVWTIGKNVVRARRGVRQARLPTWASAAPPDAPAAPGGTIVEEGRVLTADDPLLVGPVLTEAAYHDVLASDLGRLYRPRDERDLPVAWGRTVADLDALQRAAAHAGSRVALALLPSELQIDPALRHATVARLSTSLRYRGLSSGEIDPALPNQRLAEFARARGLPLVDLTPAFIAAAAAPAQEPLYKRHDNHWTPRGNRVAADSLAALLAPLVCAPERAPTRPRAGRGVAPVSTTS
jgi:SGNH hydrolase-like domain, acetyltransferase AlgX